MTTVAGGGTGLTAVGSADQLLGVSATGGALEYKTLTAGPNVTSRRRQARSRSPDVWWRRNDAPMGRRCTIYAASGTPDAVAIGTQGQV